jgi:hypothetical protein
MKERYRVAEQWGIERKDKSITLLHVSVATVWMREVYESVIRNATSSMSVTLPQVAEHISLDFLSCMVHFIEAITQCKSWDSGELGGLSDDDNCRELISQCTGGKFWSSAPSQEELEHMEDEFWLWFNNIREGEERRVKRQRVATERVRLSRLMPTLN